VADTAHPFDFPAGLNPHFVPELIWNFQKWIVQSSEAEKWIFVQNSPLTAAGFNPYSNRFDWQHHLVFNSISFSSML